MRGDTGTMLNGNLRPVTNYDIINITKKLSSPLKLLNYLNRFIKLSTFQLQEFNTHRCGYYCLLILKLLEKYDYNNIIMKLV